MRAGSARDSLPVGREHGGPRARELDALGLDAAQLLDFSVSINPYGPGPRVLQALEAARIDTYPDPECYGARARLAEANDTEPERVALGNGASELFWLLARVFAPRGRRALIVEPTFGEFRAAVHAAGGEVVEWRAPVERQLSVDLEAVADRARRARPDVVYLCAPTSPRGEHLPLDRVAHLARAIGDVPLVLDQAFTSLSDHPDELAQPLPPNVWPVRSLTKELGTPGVRIGYLLGPPRAIAELDAQRPTWTVSAAAQAAAEASVDDADWLEHCRGRQRADRRSTLEALSAVGLEPLPTSTYYAVARLPCPARRIRARLLETDGILIRDCASFGLPDFLRVAARPARDAERLRAALAVALA